MLINAGLDVIIRPPNIDEDRIKTELEQKNIAANEIAKILACEKAKCVAKTNIGAWIIGADQVLTCKGKSFEKASNLSMAASNLQFLQGSRHELHSAVSVMRLDEKGKSLFWVSSSEARLWMRPLTDDFINRYIQEAGPTILESVGCYQIEGLGVNLFARIEGDHFTILGLPLLDLLFYLRTNGVVSQ